MIDLLKLPASDAERIAYAEGFTMAAELFARIDALEHAAAVLLDALDAREPNDLDTRAAIIQLQELLP
jgi:hypothetical protein